MKKFPVFISALFLLSAQTALSDVSVTVYNNDRALVKEVREVTLKKDVQTIEFDEVAAKIEPASVLPKFLNGADKIKILEQNFDYDLADSDKLLSKYIGKDIEIERYGSDKRAKLSGKLLSVSGGLVVQSADRIVIRPQGEISFAKMPEGLRLKPTLVWLVDSGFAGKNKMELSYQTGGINWQADYVLVTNRQDTEADIAGWVTVNNKSGASYKNARLKLIAGDTNTARTAPAGIKKEAVMKFNSAKAEPSFQERSFFEYHMYELRRRSTIKDNEIKQIEFVKAARIPVKKVFAYDGTRGGKVTVNLEFKNSKENNLGIPLPKGKVRVSKRDGESMEFIGEDAIGHTAADAKLSLYVGNAFDITGERTQTNYKKESKSVEESFKIILRNGKDTDVEVNIVEHMRGWHNWKIEQSSGKYVKKDSVTAEFPVTVPANGEKEMTYTVKYWWK